MPASAATDRPASNRRRIAGPPAIALGLCALVGVVAVLPARKLPQAAVIVARDLRFTLPADGSVDVVDASTNLPAGHLAPGGQSFVQGMVHGLVVTRRQRGLPLDGAYHLAMLADGRITLSDPETEILVDLEGFGPNNAASFTAFLGDAR